MKEYKEYKVKNIKYDENGKVRSFDVNIKGANFIVYRVYNKFKPTNIFKFNKFIGFIEEEKDGVIFATGTIEIGWDTSAAGLQNLADQMGLKLVNGTGSYSIDGKKPQFIEE